jgi:GT2 family glycosyltransferase
VREGGLALVVLTHERRERVCRNVARALALPERPELIVVDNASADGTAAALARLDPRVRVLRSVRNLGAAARNLGVAATDAAYVAFADDDTWWCPGALAHAVGVLDAQPRFAVVTARVLVGSELREDPTCAEMERSTLPAPASLPGSSVVGFLAGACVVRRSAFLAAGGYEPRLFLGAEESLLALDLLAAGWRLAYCPGAVVRHEPAPRDGAARRRRLRRNVVQIAWLRRPASRAIAVTREQLAAAGGPAARALLVVDCLRALPWIVRARRPVPGRVERLLRRLEEPAATARPRARSRRRRLDEQRLALAVVEADQLGQAGGRLAEAAGADPPVTRLAEQLLDAVGREGRAHRSVPGDLRDELAADARRVAVGDVEPAGIAAPERVERAGEIGQREPQHRAGAQHAPDLDQRGNDLEVRQVLEHVDRDRAVERSVSQREADPQVAAQRDAGQPAEVDVEPAGRRPLAAAEVEEPRRVQAEIPS